MGWFSGIVVFVVCWWIAFFVTLPFGIQTSDVPGPGHVASAPVKPRLKIKAAIATVVAALGTAIIAWIIETDAIRFSGWTP